MQVVLKTNETGLQCLFDTRSNEFFSGCCVRKPENSEGLLAVANSLVSRPYKEILELAQAPSYGDEGYLEHMIATKYLEMNPDIRLKYLEKLAKPKVNKKMTYTGKKRGRKPKSETGEVKEKVVNLDENGLPRKRGRPKKIA